MEGKWMKVKGKTFGGRGALRSQKMGMKIFEVFQRLELEPLTF